VQRLAVPFIWVVITIVFCVVEPETFMTMRNLQTILSFQSVTLILTLGLLLPLTTGDFDLSMAANLGFAAMVVAVLNVHHGVPVGVAALVALALGMVVGAVNAFVVIVLGVESFIVTHASGTVLTGLTLAIGHQATIGGVSLNLVDLVGHRIFGISAPFYLSIVIALVLWWVLDFTPTGRRLLFTGTGPEVARLSGVRVSRLRWGALIAAGLLAALAGVISVGTTGAADPTSPASYLLPSFAAAYLGATTISPGRFNVWGTVVTVYFLTTGFTGLQLLGLESWIQQVFYGVALTVAVALAEYAARRRMRAPARHDDQAEVL
jgi:ribose transport system permease protein